ncbi:MAG TPA: class I SAM-dependent methyltransferase [Thermoanaerobaculia bacterium]|nr:class I SAM-dependent methyltransferase [Thermoanaerobaculia bacterium]
MTSNRKSAEQHFYDDYYEAADLDTLNGFYIHSAGVLHYESCIYADCAGKQVLEYGCGIGSYARRLAERGAFVQGIDISPEAIERARSSAAGIAEEKLRFAVADAEALQFGPGSFDMVCGTGILHHLDISRALSEIRRVLRRGGRAVFYEPIAHNPIVNLYRILTPSKHTADEHPLTMSDIRSIESSFTAFRATFFDVLSIGAIPFLGWPGGIRLLRVLESIDRRMLKTMAPLRRWAATIVLDGRS